MNKQEAYQSMLQGNKLTNEYYSPEQYVFINSDNEFEFEDGVVFEWNDWDIYQDPKSEWNWYIWESNVIEAQDKGIAICNNPMSDPYLDKLKSMEETFVITNPYLNDSGYRETYFPKPFISKNSHKRTNKRRR